MVEIEYLPYQKIIVHEVKKMEVTGIPADASVSQVEAQKSGAIPSANWVDGVAFVTGEYMATPELVGENIKGRLHYAIVIFTETNYQPEKRTNVNGREVAVRLNKADGNPNFVELVKFLKNFKS